MSMSAVTPHSPFHKSRAGYRLGSVLVFLALALVPGVPWAADPSPPVKQDGRPAAAGTDIREQRATKRVVSGDTLPRLLTDLGVSAPTRNRWVQAVAKQVGVANVLRAGDKVHFHFIADRGTLPAPAT